MRPRATPVRLGLIILATFATAACESAPPDPPPAELARFEATIEHRWEIGRDKGEEAALWQGQPSAAAMGEGRPRVVSDMGAPRLVIISEDGRAIADHRLQGDGPGEFRRIDGLGYANDSTLWVADLASRSITRMTPEGGYRSQMPMPSVERPDLGGRVTGRYLLSDDHVLGGWASTTERPLDPVFPVVVWSNGGVPRSVLEVENHAPHRLLIPRPDHPVPASSQQLVRGIPIVRPASSGRWFFVAHQPDLVPDEHGRANVGVYRFAADGSAMDTLNLSLVLSRTPPELRSQMTEYATVIAQQTGTRPEDVVEALWIPEYLPPVREMHADDEGFWVRRDQGVPGRWERYDLMGRLEARVSLPPTFHGLAATRTALLGWEMGDMGIVTVSEFAVHYEPSDASPPQVP